jgi:hypothetical protein
VANVYGMLHGAGGFDQNLGSWNVVRVSNLAAALDFASGLSFGNKRAMYMRWGTSMRYWYPTWALVDSNINGPTTGGSTLMFSGTNFGPTDTSPSMMIGLTQCTVNIWITTTSMLCVLPAGTGAGAVVTVRLASLTETLPRGLTYDGTTAVRRAACSAMIACRCAQLLS